MARRFASFVLLGPLLVWLALLMTQVPDLIRNPSLDPLPFYGLVAAILMMVGFGPAFALACADHVMARQRLSRVTRAAACAVLAYPATQLGAWMVLGPGSLRDLLGDHIFLAGLFGVIPAALCSWIAARGDRAAAPRQG
jgi:hypothetical protein